MPLLKGDLVPISSCFAGQAAVPPSKNVNNVSDTIPLLEAVLEILLAKLLVIVDRQFIALQLQMPLSDKLMDHPRNCLA